MKLAGDFGAATYSVARARNQEVKSRHVVKINAQFEQNHKQQQQLLRKTCKKLEIKCLRVFFTTER